MAVVPSPPVFTPGLSSTTQLSQLVDVIDFLLAPPRAELRQTVAQSIPNNSVTAITFDTEDLDGNVAGTAQHDNSTNSSRFTAVYAGWYQVSGGVGFSSNATGVRLSRWIVNGTTVNGSEIELAAISGAVTLIPARTIKVYLAVGDYVELGAFQNSGGSLNSAVATGTQSRMSVLWTGN